MALPSWYDFLERLQHDGVIRRIDPRTMQAIEELLDAGLAHEPEELAAALASLLATTPEQWRQVQARLRAFVAEPRAFVAGALSVEEPQSATAVAIELRAEPEPGPTRRSLLRVVEGLAGRRLRRVIGSALLILSAGFALGVMAGLVVALHNVDVIIQSSDHPGSDTEADTSAGDGGVVEVPDPTGDDGPPVPQGGTPAEPRGSSSAFIGALMLISAGLMCVGLRWISAPTAQRRRAMELHEREASDAQGPRVLYKVPTYPPFPVAVMDAAATYLARLPTTGHGLDLDVAATVRATVRAGGRTTAVLAPTRAAQDLTILVDLERGDHPFLAGVEWILQRWTQGGLRFARWTFEHHPTVLRSHPDRRETSLDAIGRRTEGSPLVLFARATQLREYEGGHGWLRQLGPWPVRAIVDLDPRADDDPALLYEERESRRALVRAGVRRFSFSAAGLVAMAQYVGSRGIAQVTAPEDRLRPTAEIAAQLDRWASCLACVPDPSWAQLEVFRREFFALELPDPRYIQRLLDWVSRPLPGGLVPDDPISADGTRINLPRRKIHHHLARLARADPLGRGRDLEVRAREVIVTQLRGMDLQSAGDRRLRDLKLAQHAAILWARDPRESADAPELEVFIGGAMEEDLERWSSDQEARYREAAEELPPWLIDLRRSLARRDLQLVHLGESLRPRELGQVVTLALVFAGAVWMTFGSWPPDRFFVAGWAITMFGVLWFAARTLRRPPDPGRVERWRTPVEVAVCIASSLYMVQDSLMGLPDVPGVLNALLVVTGIIWPGITWARGWFIRGELVILGLSAALVALSQWYVWMEFLDEGVYVMWGTGVVALGTVTVVFVVYWLIARRERRSGIRLEPRYLAVGSLCAASVYLGIFLLDPLSRVDVGMLQSLNLVFILFPWSAALGLTVLGQTGLGVALSGLGFLIGLHGCIVLLYFYLFGGLGFTNDFSLPIALLEIPAGISDVLLMFAGCIGLARLGREKADDRSGGEFTMGSPETEPGHDPSEGPRHRV